MGDAYRTANIDMTTIRSTAIHEAAETKRKLIEEREATKRVRMQEIGYAPHGFLAATVVAVAVIGGIASHAIVEERVKEQMPCRDSVRERDAYGSAECGHALHVLVQDEKTWTCKCGIPRLP